MNVNWGDLVEGCIENIEHLLVGHAKLTAFQDEVHGFFRGAEITSFLVEVLAVRGVEDGVAFDKGKGLQAVCEGFLAPENESGHGVGPHGGRRTLVLEQGHPFLLVWLLRKVGSGKLG